MPETRSGSPACPDKDRQQRLVVQLADMIPGAATVRVSLTDPRSTWPQPHAVVRGATGRPVELSRTTSTTVARWIKRTWSDADWTRAHVLDLATATLSPSNPTVTGRGL
ncbi:transcriptional regulator [Streptomyces sp. HPF1205]|uniref:transcriptional regulator n=1 Tax=Streptomyces sp. HPF1205 TaxID=2873262 RepID=UPI001CECED0D|nr:transcriptional regulator [Streptomyces sp. HPF1205]